MLGITLDQLASIEYGRTPLRYDIAWKIRALLGISLEWLSVGEFYPDSLFQDDLPSPVASGLRDNALLSEVSDKIHGPVGNQDFAENRVPKYKIDDTELNHRAFIFSALRLQIEDWIPRIPRGYTADFADKIIQVGNQYLAELPKDPSELIEVRADALMWEKLRSAIAQKLAPVEKEAKTELTKKETYSSIADVKELWPSLKQRLQLAAAKAGKKSELAKFLGVDLTRVSQWLTEKKFAREPGAEYTLQMLHWVEQQERQK